MPVFHVDVSCLATDALAASITIEAKSEDDARAQVEAGRYDNNIEWSWACSVELGATTVDEIRPANRSDDR